MPVRAAEQLIAVKAERLFDGKSKTLLHNGVILIQGDKIADVGSNLTIPSDAQVIDLGDATLAPGFMDAHTHLTLDYFGPQILGEAFAGKTDHCVGGGENGLGRAVVAIECDDLGGRGKLLREVKNVAHGGGAEGIDRLGVVPHHRQAMSIRLEGEEDGGLQPVGVLVFVNQDMVEARSHGGGDHRLGHHMRPPEQEVVIVEHIVP